MKLYITRRNNSLNAIADYDESAGTVTVLKGSRVSNKIAHCATFRGAKAIEKARDGAVVDGIVVCDVVFKSASTAANFVTGTSTNGLTAWKNENRVTLKALMSKGEKHEQTR